MPTQPFTARFADLPRTVLAADLTRAAVRTDDALVTFNWIEPGEPAPPHHDHPFDQLALILSGRFEFDLDGTPYPLEAGQLLYIPAGVPHTAHVIGDETVLNVDVFAPAREDYLPLTDHQPG